MLNKTRRALVASVAVCSLALTACSNTAENARENAAVSYTHLTLPTIYSV